MKRIKKLLFGLTAIFLTACSGSDVYQGNWKALNSKGEKFEILFEGNKFNIKDSIGETRNFDYTQHSVMIENSVRTYGIQLSDGRGYEINFPLVENTSVALIKDENLLYTISREDYVTYEDIYKLE